MGSLRLRIRHRSGHRPDLAALRDSVQTVFSANGVDVQITVDDTAALDLEGMTSLAVGSCVNVLGKHRSLFDAVAPVIAPRGEAVVFVVGRITDGESASGCAAHPASCPGVVITETAAAAAAGTNAAAGRWVLAHEIGHLLDLDHTEGTRSLMCDPPTSITSDPPELSESERTTVAASALLSVALVDAVAPSAAEFAARTVKKKRTIKRVAPKAKRSPRRKPGVRKRAVPSRSRRRVATKKRKKRRR